MVKLYKIMKIYTNIEIDLSNPNLFSYKIDNIFFEFNLINLVTSFNGALHH